MLWLYVMILSQLIFAIVTLADKYLLSSKNIGNPVAYAFYVGVMSIAVLWILPFGWVQWLSFR